MTATQPFIALLRGVNVGGRRRVPMAALRDVAGEVGLSGVRTYLQSGNLVFEAPPASIDALVGDLEKAIAEAFGAHIAVIPRSRDQLAATATANPFPEVEKEPTHLHVVFLADEPADGLASGLDSERFLPDTFELRGREVFVHYPSGQGRSKLTLDYFERQLRTAATGRNWNTVTKLLAMTAE